MRRPGERQIDSADDEKGQMTLLNRVYYRVKPFIPRKLQIQLRRWAATYKRRLARGVWPIDPCAGEAPQGWRGWPQNKKFALVLTHDVETKIGHEKVREVMALDKKMGFRSSFNFVAKRYEVSRELRDFLNENGFETAVHGLYHDGRLFESKKTFKKRAVLINRYLKEWDSVGFTSPSMHQNLDWIHDLSIEYDQSTFDTDPFEPHPEGQGTIFPFWVNGREPGKGYVEQPYTLPQDFTLFIILKESNIRIWKQKLDWIAEKGGMALLNTHPDYMNCNVSRWGTEEYPVGFYGEFLAYLKSKYDGQYWNVLPKEMARFWKEKMVNQTNKKA
jgi:hypothetical protein